MPWKAVWLKAVWKRRGNVVFHALYYMKIEKHKKSTILKKAHCTLQWHINMRYNGLSSTYY